jgi:hypothetical protein
MASGWGEQMQIADDWYMLLEMALKRPCQAAFSLTPRWRKRVDGLNVYDGRPFAEAARKLYLHDQRIFRQDFRASLTRRERLTLGRRAAGYRLRLLLHETAQTGIGARLKLPHLIERLRGLTQISTEGPARVKSGIRGKD